MTMAAWLRKAFNLADLPTGQTDGAKAVKHGQIIDDLLKKLTEHGWSRSHGQAKWKFEVAERR